MSANLDTTLGFVALAFTGPRSKIWHGTGNSVDAKVAELGRSLTIEEWATLSGSDFTVEARPLFYTDATGLRHDYPDRFANVRADTDAALGLVSDRYSLVQPLDVQETFAAIISADDRFQLTTMGSLDGGKRVWAQAEFTGEQTIAGDRHRAKLLMSTTFDTTSPTRLQGCMERVVCENTIRVAMGEHAPTVDVRHNTKFDRDTAIKKLAKIAEGFAQFKLIGDALAQTVMGADAVSAFIRGMLDIPVDAKKEDVSTRKHNQRQAIIDAMLISCHERDVSGAANIDAFTALQAITRYVDHDRDASNTSNRLFGSGAAFKDKALGLLMPLIKDRVAA
jgi:phage/plasmid-like protein (TIGR03299 family)